LLDSNGKDSAFQLLSFIPLEVILPGQCARHLWWVRPIVSIGRRFPASQSVSASTSIETSTRLGNNTRVASEFQRELLRDRSEGRPHPRKQSETGGQPDFCHSFWGEWNGVSPPTPAGLEDVRGFCGLGLNGLYSRILRIQRISVRSCVVLNHPQPVRADGESWRWLSHKPVRS
jgi:hypothetical protein